MKPSLKYFVLFLLVVALAPFFIICFYALPFADDFCFGWTASENISFLQKFLNQYLYWNGRYTADVLVNLHPLVSGKILNYQLAIFVSLIATPFVLWLFIRCLISDFIVSFIASLFITLLYLNYQPNFTEGVYWFIGISNYHLCILLFLLQLTILLKSISAKGRIKLFFQFVSGLLLIASVGFNEIGAMLIPFFYVSIAVFNRKQEKEEKKLWIVFALVAFLASAFVFFSPGNFVRTHEFENRFDLLHSLFYASLQTVRFLAKWILNVPLLLMSLLVIIYADKIKNRQIDYRLLLAGLLIVVFTGSFLPYFATGVLGQHRTINFVFFFFILFWILFLLSVSEKFLLHQKFAVFKNEKATVVVLTVSILIMMVTGNSFKIINDLRQDNFRKYETIFIERETSILQNPSAIIKKLKIMPATFTVVDVRSDTAWWVDKCMKKYYTERKQTTFLFRK